MIKAGLTGGIGSGKTYVAKVFKTMGIPVFDADEEASKITRDDPDIKAAIIRLFGEHIYTGEQADRKAIANAVFADPEKLRQLNQIIHPAVRIQFACWVRAQTAPLCIKEAAILYESGSYKELDATIVVTAPEHLRISRVMERDHVSRKQVIARMQNQWTDQDRLALADFVIINDGKRLLLPQILRIMDKLL